MVVQLSGFQFGPVFFLKNNRQSLSARPLSLITSMIIDRIGQHKVLLSTWDYREDQNSVINKIGRTIQCALVLDANSGNPQAVRALIW